MRQRVDDRKRSFARALRRAATDTERRLWSLLRDRRFASMKFRRQVPIGPWIVDFVSFETKLIIEADGGQHADSERDAVRDQDLRDRGFRILRFWNNDVLLRSQSVSEAIFDALGSPSPDAAPFGAPPPSPTRGEGR